MTGLGIIYAIVIIGCLAFLAWMKYTERHSKQPH